MTTTLRTDPARERSAEWCEYTGIYVTAMDSAGRLCNFDVAQLSRESLIAWLYSGQPFGRDIQKLVLQACGHEP